MLRIPRLARIPRAAALAFVLAASPFAACQCSQKDAPSTSAPTGAPTSPTLAPAPADPSAPPAEIPAAEAVRRITELADKICACPDRACAEATRVGLEEQNRKDAGRPRAKPTADEAASMRGQAKRIADCVEQLR